MRIPKYSDIIVLVSIFSEYTMKPKYEPYFLSDVKRESAKNKFTVISTFAGGGGSSTGYRLAGGNVLLINEFVEEAIATYKANFPETKVLVDDIKKYKGEDFLSMSSIQPGELDIFDGSPPCFVAGTLIHTKRGFVPIEQVVLGDEVLTHNNRFRKVLTVMQKQYDGIVHKIQAMGSETITCTPEHPFYVKKRLTKSRKKLAQEDWIDAKDLRQGDFVSIAIDQTETDYNLDELMNTWSCAYREYDTEHQQSFLENDRIWTSIRSIEEQQFSGIVYNLSVEEDETYTANNIIVHNCSAFSVAGKREKGWNQTKVYSDGKVQNNIEDLFLEFIRVANVIRPKVIVAENVQGITVGEAIKKLNEFINRFEDIGYHTSYEVLSSADFGVAQNRRRTIFVCVRHDVADAIGLSVLNINSILPKPTTQHCSMESAIGDIINDSVEEQMLFDYVQKSFQKEIVERMPFRPKKPLSYDAEQFRQWNPKGSYFNMIRPSADMPCPTITQIGQRRSVSGVLHYEKNRKLTVAEMKRIMSLPDDYVLTGTFDQQAERICRMVPPKLICAVATSIHDNVLVPYRKTL